jgi:hypothetical protein
VGAAPYADCEEQRTYTIAGNPSDVSEYSFDNLISDIKTILRGTGFALAYLLARHRNPTTFRPQWGFGQFKTFEDSLINAVCA